LLLLATLAFLLATTVALAVTGDLTQPAGTAGCISATGAGPCADGRGLHGADSVAVAPGGKSVYVASGLADAVVRLNRNRSTGAITQPAGSAGCISETGSGAEPCADGHGLERPTGVAVSADGKSVYVVSAGSDAVARLNRNTTTGAITQPAGSAGCISETGAGPCADGRALDSTQGLAVSPDGKSVYVATVGDIDNGGLVRLNRDPTTGAITQPAGTAGCISQPGYGAEPCADGHALDGVWDVTVSPDGKSVYVATAGGISQGAVARLNRNTTTGAISQPAGAAGCISQTGNGAEPCADGHELSGPLDVAVSPDGKSVYVATSTWSVVRLTRNTTTGAISQPAGAAGCISEDGGGPCADGRALEATQSVAVAPGGKSVYVASYVSNAVARLNRNTTTGAITQPAGTAGCISQTGEGPCADGRALKGAYDVAVSPNGRSVYVASSVSDAVVRFNRAP
jgi:DNA-binding beta-propeller fold protein YncE